MARLSLKRVGLLGAVVCIALLLIIVTWLCPESLMSGRGAEPKALGPEGQRSDGNAAPKRRRTFYKWNDRSTNDWKRLPLRRHRNGTLAAGGLTPAEARQAVIYTRVPKTGSRYMLELMAGAAASNRYSLVYSVVYNHSGIGDRDERARFVRSVGRLRTPFLLARQLFFLDFTEFGGGGGAMVPAAAAAQPTYLSLVRDPVSRLESSFNFNRFGDGTRNRWHEMFRGNKTMTLDECIARNDTECTDAGASVTIRYFCGQGRECKQPSDWSLQRAMDNIRRHYIVVGLTDDYETTVKVFEKVLPTFFRGMTKFYKPSSSDMKTASKKKFKVSPEARIILRRRFHLEYKLFDFIKTRFYELAEKFDIKPKAL